MRKIPDNMDSPIDNGMIALADTLCPFFKSTGHTPNMITTYSLITGVLSVICLYNGYPIAFGILYTISYFFDCMDGHFARKYSMTSKGGDLYDHIKDVSVYILLIYVVYIKYRKVIQLTDLVIIFIAVLVSCAHMGCQQKQLDKEEDDETLDYAKCLCPDKNMIYYTRWMGMGTFMLVTIVMILYIHYRCNAYMGATGELSCKA